MSGTESEKKRPYQMRARAESAAQTGERILDAAAEIFNEQPLDQISLAMLADRAGVTVQTILRRYGNKERLFEAAIARVAARVNDQRGTAAPGDVEGALRILVEHYDEIGDRVIRFLAEERRDESLRAIADMGRRFHVRWCERVFGPSLDGLEGELRERRLAQLVAVTDVYVWKVLRRDRKLSVRQTELAMREMVEPLLGPPR